MMNNTLCQVRQTILEPKHELPVPVRSVYGIEEITSLMDRWEASNDKSHKL